MKLSEHWLRQWVNPSLSTHELSEQLAMIGLTVDAVIPVAGEFSNVVIGEVLSTKQHPNADKLTCCIVDIGEEQKLSIVCGAPNARAGIKVVVAKVGAVLPGDFKIKEAKLRGELSQGMLCSAKELQLQMGQSTQDGIIELPKDAKVGDDFNNYFKANDHILDIEITPNRGDCLSVRGVARDVASATQLPFKEIKITSVSDQSKSSFSVNVIAPSDCPRYVGRVICNVNNTVETPSFMQQCLQRAGIRLINPVVDVCNYVMLELGQPMHAFDLSKLQGKLNIRRAKKDEKIHLLDESTIQLTSDDLIIADDKSVHALAGIMGGIESCVSTSTQDIFLEAAFFNPKTICLSKRRHAINTDSSYRFERGVDFDLARHAIERATELLLKSTQGNPEEIVEIVSKDHLPTREKIILKKTEINRILGIDIPSERIENILQSLGMVVKQENSHYEVTPPTFRFDITLPIDLIEELARIVGYQTIAPQKMVGLLQMQSLKHFLDKRFADLLIDRGYHEAITYSFIEPSVQQLFSPTVKPMSLQNPLSQDLSVMRDSLWPGLLQAIQMNVRHQMPRVRLFEMGLCFIPENNELLQIRKIALAATGSLFSAQWNIKSKSVDFFDLKSDVTALLALSHSEDQFSFQLEKHPALHPGRSCAIIYNQKIVGWIGECHPNVLSYFDLREPVIVCELDYDAISTRKLITYQSFSRFPLVQRDLAIVLDEKITAEEVSALITQNSGPQLKNVQIFDIYQGKGIESGKKSIALSLTFQDPSRTLRDEEINEVIHGVVVALKEKWNATLRA